MLCFYLQGKEECTDSHRHAQTRTMRQTDRQEKNFGRFFGLFLYSIGLYRSRGVTCKLTRKTLTICEYVERGEGEQQAEFAKVEHKQNAEEAAAGKADRRRKSEQKKRSVTKICFAIEQNQQQQQQIRKKKSKEKNVAKARAARDSKLCRAGQQHFWDFINFRLRRYAFLCFFFGERKWAKSHKRTSDRKRERER